MTSAWRPGQSVILDGKITEIERVTPAGWAVVEGRRFGPDGTERKRPSAWGARSRLELASPEKTAKLAKQAEDGLLCRQIWAAITRLEQHARWHYPSRTVPDFTPDERAALTTLISVIDKITDNTPEP